MTEYKILKEFVTPRGNLMTVGTDDAEFGYSDYAEYVPTLIKHGFIEKVEVKDDDTLWSHGQKLNEYAWKIYGSGATCCTKIEPDEAYLCFNTEREANYHANHLRIENELINKAVRDYGAKTRSGGGYAYCAEYSTYDYVVFIINGLYFNNRTSRDSFVHDNADLIREWASCFIENEVCDE